MPCTWPHWQVVWKQTSAVGCAVAGCSGPQLATYVCLYSPAGNVESAAEFAANVLPFDPNSASPAGLT